MERGNAECLKLLQYAYKDNFFLKISFTKKNKNGWVLNLNSKFMSTNSSASSC